MPKFEVKIAMDIRAYGFVKVEAESADKIELTAEFIADNFEPHGSGSDDLDYNHPRDIWANEVTNEAGEDVGYFDQVIPDGDWITRPTAHIVLEHHDCEDWVVGVFANKAAANACIDDRVKDVFTEYCPPEMENEESIEVMRQWLQDNEDKTKSWGIQADDWKLADAFEEGM